ncbi:MAG: NAD(P)-dependent oxidoreductase [Hellea sp.]|nr:NAD(P)-dependent oxidoreductase [Hellea sp.]
MPQTVISGGTGFVGRLIVEQLLSAGHGITVIGRNQHAKDFFSAPVRFVEGGLGDNVDYRDIFEIADNYVHASLDHIAGRLAGGEGDDPKGFALKNLAGAAALFKQAKKSKVGRAIFLSDMAVYGRPFDGDHFYETETPEPQNLYARIKSETEAVLQAMNSPEFATASLRLAPVYGPAGKGKTHPWSKLFKAYMSGQAIRPFASCQVHGEDVGRAVEIMLSTQPIRMAGGIFNVMDMVVDRRDVLALLQKAIGCDHKLPNKFDRDVSTMNCDKMKGLDWRTGGSVKLSMSLERMFRSLRN